VTPGQIVVLGLVVPAVSYCAVAYGYVGLQRPWMGVAFIGYVIGNIGFIMDALK
jgi:hypothetical protein